MLKILSVAFVGHPVLGNLELDFCDESGNPADTILIAGENGTGKSSILEALYGIAFPIWLLSTSLMTEAL